MLKITVEENRVIRLVGRCHAAETDKLEEALRHVEESTVVDFSELSYISSAGIGLLFAAHKKLGHRKRSLKLVNLNSHIREIFGLAGFDSIFEIE